MIGMLETLVFQTADVRGIHATDKVNLDNVVGQIVTSKDIVADWLTMDEANQMCPICGEENVVLASFHCSVDHAACV